LKAGAPFVYDQPPDSGRASTFHGHRMPDAPPEFRYKRILLKVSGEVLMGDQAYGIDMKTVADVAGAVASVAREGVEICLVIGGGNIFRGLSRRRATWTAPPPTTWACWRR
jgi:uridylate kinase